MSRKLNPDQDKPTNKHSVDKGKSERNNLSKKVQPEIQKKTGRLDELDAHQNSLDKNLEDTSNLAGDLSIEMNSPTQVLSNQTRSPVDAILHKPVAIVKGMHRKTQEKEEREQLGKLICEIHKQFTSWDPHDKTKR